jgi:glycosyltransferase involved in cell wall biosynthesis
LIANAKVGSYKTEVDALLARLPKGSFHEIEFENDLFSLYQLFDVYVHTPIDNELEAFGQTYVEALAAGIPSVFTLSGVANEFIEHERNALVVGYQNSDEILAGVTRLLEDEALRKRLAAQGRADVVERFSIENQIRKFEDLYSK